MMGSEICALKGDHRVRSAVRLAEGVAVEAQHHRPDPFDRLNRNPVVYAPPDELFPIRFKALMSVFLGDDLTQLIRFDLIKTRQGDRCLRDILLITEDSIGFSENRFKTRVKMGKRLAVQAFDIFADEAIGGGADHRRMDDDVIEIAFFRLLLELAHRRAFDVEHPHRISPGEGVLRFDIIDRPPSVFIDDDSIRLEIGQGVPDHRKGAVAQNVQLHEPRKLASVLLPHQKRIPVAGTGDRGVCDDRLRRDDDSAGVGSDLFRKTCQMIGDGPDRPPIGI